MKRAAWICLIAMLLPGCSTTQAYQQYALAIQHAAEARSAAQVEQSKAIMQLALSGDATTKTVAVMLLAMQAGNKEQVNIQPPQNEALQWAQALLPTVTALGMGYWGFRLGQTQSDNQAATTQSSYGALVGIANGGFGAIGQFKPVPFDWSGLAALQPNVTTTTTTNTTTTTPTTCSSSTGSVNC